MTRTHISVATRWKDVDAAGHVSHVEVARLLEEARIRLLFADLGGPPPAGSPAILDMSAKSATLAVVAHQSIEHLAPISYQKSPLDVQLWLSKVGGASIVVRYEVWSPQGVEPATLHCRAEVTVVLTDSSTGGPRRISPEERQAWLPLVHEQVFAGDAPFIRPR